jgi:hypothetical protein
MLRSAFGIARLTTLVGVVVATALLGIARADDEPGIVVTDSTATAWFPVVNAQAKWDGRAANSGTSPLYTAKVELPLFDDTYELSFWSSSELDVATFDDLVHAGKIRLFRMDDDAHNSALISTLASATPGADGFTVTFSDKEWVPLLAGLYPDSLTMTLWFAHPISQPHDWTNHDNQWTRRVKVEYRLSPGATKRAAAAYRERAQAEQQRRSRAIPARKIDKVLVCFRDKENLGFFDVNGHEMKASEMKSLVPDTLLSTIKSRTMTTFALCGNHLFFTDVSIFDVSAASGEIQTVLEGAEAHYGVYYTEVVVDPTGRYLAVSGGNGTDWGFLWDIDHQRSVRELCCYPSTWSADGLGVTQERAWYPVNPSQNPVYLEADEQSVLNRDYVYWITRDQLTGRQGKKTPFQIASIPAHQAHEPWWDDTRVLGFVGNEIYVRSGSVIVVCNNNGETRRFDAGSRFANTQVSLQYVFAPR